MNLKNTESGKVHAAGADYLKILKKVSFPLLCGVNTTYDISQFYTETTESINCKTCLRIINCPKKKEVPSHICSKCGQLKALPKLSMGRKPCYFCGAKTVRVHEHYVFCPECMVVYTNHIKYEKGCEHIEDGTPNVLHSCVHKSARKGKTYLIEHPNSKLWACSKCGEYSKCGGW